MMPAPLWDVEVSRMAVGVLLDASLKGLMILLLAALAVLLLRRASAAARHLVWSLTFAALLALPLLSAALPRWEIPVWPASAPVATRISLAPTRAAVSTGLYVPGTSPAPDVPAIAFSWSTIVAGVWFAGAVLALATLLFGMVRVRWLARRARPVTKGPWAALAEQLRAELGLYRSVQLLESRDSVMPMTWGTLRPVVLLPASAGHWPAPRCEAVLRHELAHVQRWDALTQLGAELACALYWFNPLVWVAARWLRIEREQACDDRVLGAGTKPSDYANQLLETARSLRVERGTSGAAIAMARRSQLSVRLRAVLDEKRCRDTVARWLAVITSLAAVALVLPLAAMRPSPRSHHRAALTSAVATKEIRGVPKMPETAGPSEATGGLIPRGGAGPLASDRAQHDTVPKWVAGVAGATEVNGEGEFRQVAQELAGSKEQVEPTIQRLQRLSKQPGMGLYLQFNRSVKPFSVVLAPLGPSDGSREVVMPVGKLALQSGPKSLSGTSSGLPMVATFWVNDAAQRVYTFRVPETVQYVTIVRDNDVIAAAYPLNRKKAGGLVTFHVK